MPEDTAVLEAPGTSAPEVEASAPQLDELVEQPTEELETAGIEAEAETDEPGEPETLTREQAEALAEERITKLREEWEGEAARQREAAEREQRAAQYRQRVAQADATFQQTGVQSLQNLVAWVEKQVNEGNTVAANPQVLAAIAAPIQQAVHTAYWSQFANQAWAAVAEQAKGWKASPEMVTAYQDAAYSGDPAQLTKAIATLAQEAFKETEMPKLKEQWLKELKAEQQDAQKLATARKAQAGSNGQAPTRLGAGGAGRTNYDDIINSPSATRDQKQAALRAKHGL